MAEGPLNQGQDQGLRDSFHPEPRLQILVICGDTTGKTMAIAFLCVFHDQKQSHKSLKAKVT